MNAERECPHVEQAIGLALHALEPADEVLLAGHVPHCTVCQALVRQTQDVVWGLAAANEQRDPPSWLRTNLMAAVAATPQLPPEQRERPWVTEPPEPPATAVAEVTERGAIPRPSGERQPSASAASGWSAKLTRPRLIVLVATVLVAVVSSVVTVGLIGRASQQQQAVLAAPSPEVSRILADADRAGARHAVLHAPDGEVVAAVAQFANARQVMPIKLPANPADHSVYVLWGIGDGPPAAIGTFDVSAPSETMLPVGQVTKQGNFRSYAISIETGRSAPPSPGLVVASGQVQS
jgi:hypothetical protein